MVIARPDRIKIGEYWPALVFAVLLIVDIVLKRRFTGLDLRTLCTGALPLVLVAMGQFLIVLARGIDLSLGPVASVAGVLMATTVTDHPMLGIAGPLAIGLIAGLINGLLVAHLRLPPIIVTLATMSIWQGVALMILPDPGGAIPQELQEALTGGFSHPVVGLIELILCGVVAAWLLSTRFGLHLRAVGGDELAARMSGVRVRNVKTAAYVLGGLLAALGGMYFAVTTNTGTPTSGDSFILTSIAAVVIGGVPLGGGRGTALGVVMGTLTLTITGSLLYFADVSSFYQSLIDGVILLAVVGSSGARDWLRGLVRS